MISKKQRPSTSNPRLKVFKKDIIEPLKQYQSKKSFNRMSFASKPSLASVDSLP